MGANMNILIASRNVFRLELSAYVLSEAGYCVRECRDDNVLLQELASQPLDLLLIDQQMLQSNDSEQVRLLAQQHQVHILLLTTHKVIQQLEEYLVWPYQPQDLLARVRMLCYPNALPA